MTPGSIIRFVFTVFNVILFARIIFSWIRVDPYHPVWGPLQRFVFEITEPILAPVRRMMPQTGMMDFSVLVVFFLAYILESMLLGLVGYR
jgi:YggT family protein